MCALASPLWRGRRAPAPVCRHVARTAVGTQLFLIGNSLQVMYHLESYEDVLQLFRSYAEVIAAKAQARVLIACCATLTHALRTGCASCAEATTLAAASRLPPCC